MGFLFRHPELEVAEVVKAKVDTWIPRGQEQGIEWEVRVFRPLPLPLTGSVLFSCRHQQTLEAEIPTLVLCVLLAEQNCLLPQILVAGGPLREALC